MLLEESLPAAVLEFFEILVRDCLANLRQLDEDETEVEESSKACHGEVNILHSAEFVGVLAVEECVRRDERSNNGSDTIEALSKGETQGGVPRRA